MFLFVKFNLKLVFNSVIPSVSNECSIQCINSIIPQLVLFFLARDSHVLSTSLHLIHLEHQTFFIIFTSDSDMHVEHANIQ